MFRFRPLFILFQVWLASTSCATYTISINEEWIRNDRNIDLSSYDGQVILEKDSSLPPLTVQLDLPGERGYTDVCKLEYFPDTATLQCSDENEFKFSVAPTTKPHTKAAATVSLALSATLHSKFPFVLTALTLYGQMVHGECDSTLVVRFGSGVCLIESESKQLTLSASLSECYSNLPDTNTPTVPVAKVSMAFDSELSSTQVTSLEDLVCTEYAIESKVQKYALQCTATQDTAGRRLLAFSYQIAIRATPIAATDLKEVDVDITTIVDTVVSKAAEVADLPTPTEAAGVAETIIIPESESALPGGNSSSDSSTAAPSTSPTTAPSAHPTSSPTTGTPTAAPTAAPSQHPTDSPTVFTYPLPKSEAGTLIMLFDRVDGAEYQIARSYAGFEWEGTPPYPAQPVCEANEGCHLDVGISETSDFRLETISVSADLPNEASIARLLRQTTFGATRGMIDQYIASHTDTSDTAVTDWVQAEMAKPATAHREYYRKRSNPPLRGTTIKYKVRQPCDIGSRWHRQVFHVMDQKQTLVVTADEVAGKYTLKVDGELRGEVDSFLGDPHSSDIAEAEYTICAMKDAAFVGGLMKISKVVGDCSDTIEWANPAIDFTSTDADTTQTLTTAEAEFVEIATSKYWGTATNVLILKSMSAVCTLKAGAQIPFVKYDGAYYRHDIRLKMFDNTIDKPADDLSSELAETCPTATKNLLNRDGCKRKDVCAPTAYTASDVVLNDENLRFWYTSSGRYTHYLEGLVPDGTPCKRQRSRWFKHSTGACSSPSALDADTITTLKDYIEAADDSNSNLRDVDGVKNGGTCVADAGVLIDAAGDCWEHVHDDHHSVYDFTHWTTNHYGNNAAMTNNRPNPITAFAISGSVKITYPYPAHTLARWGQFRGYVADPIGRYGDTVSFNELSVSLQTAEMAAHIGSSQVQPAAVEACGSEGEVKNEPTYGHRYIGGPFGDFNHDVLAAQLDWPYFFYNGVGYVWHNAVLSADDQLRQRVAWSLWQTFPVSISGNDDRHAYESWTSFYDIFVNNAFGNYRDVLQQITYHPRMGDYLTYRTSKSIKASGTSPDENFARELMQLFTIGLWELELDGTRKVDDDGKHIPTYGQDNIDTFARAWTGFDRQQFRGNLEGPYSRPKNQIDPMSITVDWRDAMPKSMLGSGYLGDGLPLCTELPPSPFLSTGARFVFTGEKSAAWLLDEQADLANRRGRFRPDPTSSALYAKLCERDSVTNLCTFPQEVTLTEKLACHGVECNAGDFSTVQMVDGDRVRYYTFVKQVCVHQTLFNGATLKYTKSQSGAEEMYQCANPEAAVGSAVCCSPDDPSQIISHRGDECLFTLEKVTLATVSARCAAQDGVVCQDHSASGFGKEMDSTCGYGMYQWTSVECQVQIQIHPSGRLTPTDSLARAHWPLDSKSEFLVHWEGGRFPTVAEGCADITGCTVEGLTCLCTPDVVREAAFVEADGVPSLSAVKESCLFGAVDPAEFPAGTYEKVSFSDELSIYLKAGGGWDEHAVFELPPKKAGSPPQWLLNRKSTIKVGEDFTFRNPPHFMPLLGHVRTNLGYWHQMFPPETASNAEAETAALLDHLFEHPNTAPFVSHRLIQRLTSSNPSSRYVGVVAEAFRTGTHDGHTYSGKYGDLGAAVAAIITDREARSSELDMDPNAGRLREPLLLMLHFLRAMEFETSDGREVMIKPDFGMTPYGSDSVFGFYQPDYVPATKLATFGLVSPEAQLSTPPNVISFLNGLNFLIENGLSYCMGADWGEQWSSFVDCSSSARKRETADGHINFPHPADMTSSEVVDELALLLTDGRLNEQSRSVIKAAYERKREGKIEPAASYTAVVASTCNCESGFCKDAESTGLSRFMFRIEQTEEVRTGISGESDIVIRGNNGNEYVFNRVNHFAWAGKYVFFYPLKTNDPTFDYAAKVTAFNDAFPIGTTLEFFWSNEETKRENALQAAQKLILLAPEFHSTGDNILQENDRAVPEPVPSSGEPYKAVVVLFFNGGHDSWQTIAPHSQCGDFDLNAEYTELRGTCGLSKSTMLQIDVPDGTQPCNKFGVHPKLPFIKELYDQGDLSFVANLGVMIEPITKTEYKDKSKQAPPSLFSHNVMQLSMHSVHAQNIVSKGILGRLSDGLSTQSAARKTKIYSLMGNVKMVEGDQEVDMVHRHRGVVRFSNYEALKDDFEGMARKESISPFSETIASSLETSFRQTEFLGPKLDGATLSTTFSDSNDGRSLSKIARLIKLRSELDAERDSFVYQRGGSDTHFTCNLNEDYTELNAALKKFVTELKAQGIWDHVTIVTTSEFGRQLGDNGAGTDHGWGGNYMVMGGSVNGGQILGKYPPRLHEDSDVNVGHGVVLPTTPWESVWKPIAEWTGLEPDKIAEVVPNAANFPDQTHITKAQLFK